MQDKEAVFDTSREALIERIISWSDIKDEKLLAIEVKKCAQYLRAGHFTTALKRGDLVIIKQDNSFVYSRVEEVTSSNHVRVFVDPTETKSLTVPNNDCFYFTPEMRQNLKGIPLVYLSWDS